MGWDSHKLPWDKMTQQKFPMNKIGNSFILQTIELRIYRNRIAKQNCMAGISVFAY